MFWESCLLFRKKMYQGYAKNGGVSTTAIEITKLMRISNNKNFKKKCCSLCGCQLRSEKRNLICLISVQGKVVICSKNSSKFGKVPITCILPVYEISNNFRYLLNIPRFSKLPTVEIY
jgi:hypothetical protein